MIDLAERLSHLLGKKGWIRPPDCERWQRDWLDRSGEKPLGVALPSSSACVARVLQLCASAGVPVVPQGGNTSLAGGAVLEKPDGVILSLSQMNAISEPDIESGIIEVEAGVILTDIHKALEGTGMIFPMHLGSEGTAQVGGLVATNAGGSHAFRYGMMHDLILGLEVVLPDGSIWDGMRSVQKDNTGYQLRKLFCGSEGTLGVITRAKLQLFPEHKQRVTACIAVPHFEAAINFATRCRLAAGEFLTAMEFFSDFGLDMALSHIPSLSFPLTSRSPYYLLIEAGSCSEQVPLESILNNVIEHAFEIGIILDGVVATSLSQRASLWRLREDQPEGQRLEGPQLKHDISVAPGRLANFLNLAEKSCSAILPGVRINPFGHLGDGNVHYNLSPPYGTSDFLGREDELGLQLGTLATEMGGSFAAEHGLGRTKVWLADALRDPVERNLMRSIKRAIDRAENLNSGTLVRL